MSNNATPEGWVFALNFRKAHYIRGNISLCERWAYFGQNFDKDDRPSPDDCKSCRRKLEESKNE